MKTFELCKKLHELKPGWSPEDRLFIRREGELPEVVKGVNFTMSFDNAPRFTLEYLLDKLPNIIDSDSGFGTLALSTRQGQYRNGWLALYEDDEGCAVEDGLCCAAQTPLDAVLKLAIVMIEKGIL